MIYIIDETRPNIKDHQKEPDDGFITFFYSLLPCKCWIFANNLEMPAVEPQEAADLQ